MAVNFKDEKWIELSLDEMFFEAIALHQLWEPI